MEGAGDAGSEVGRGIREVGAWSGGREPKLERYAKT